MRLIHFKWKYCQRTILLAISSSVSTNKVFVTSVTIGRCRVPEIKISQPKGGVKGLIQYFCQVRAMTNLIQYSSSQEKLILNPWTQSIPHFSDECCLKINENSFSSFMWLLMNVTNRCRKIPEQYLLKGYMSKTWYYCWR